MVNLIVCYVNRLLLIFLRVLELSEAWGSPSKHPPIFYPQSSAVFCIALQLFSAFHIYLTHIFSKQCWFICDYVKCIHLIKLVILKPRVWQSKSFLLHHFTLKWKHQLTKGAPSIFWKKFKVINQQRKIKEAIHIWPAGQNFHLHKTDRQKYLYR